VIGLLFTENILVHKSAFQQALVTKSLHQVSLSSSSLSHGEIVPEGGVAATMLRRPEPPEWRAEPTTLGETAIEFPHSTR